MGEDMEGLIEPMAAAPRRDAAAPAQGWAAFSFRAQGMFVAHMNVQQGLTRSSYVFASLTELDEQATPHLGEAVLTVHNVVPTDSHTVILRGEVAWPTHLHITAYVFFVN
ncbi:hypothetical protein [Streptomyces marincola]|uniref:hypothetical protein n=1 Tax=Streptomyces marincola TaxID=2878388 RepID=UPI001CF39315|nr:hypothetical protein [Streptomyces marincola]UCM89045.1 hypothetical protein LC193_14400 [Streptomyces marincola]